MKTFIADAFFTMLCGFVFIVLCVLLLNSVFQPTLDNVEWVEEIYTVKGGDSLWSISGYYCPDDVDRREWIDEVKSLNGLTDSTIHPGQRLTVLIPAERRLLKCTSD